MWPCPCLVCLREAKFVISHLACVGAGIIILIHGFETFSQEMVTFDDAPTPLINIINPAAPPPARSETWQNVVPKGPGGGRLNKWIGSKHLAHG